MSDLQRLLFHDSFEKREKWFNILSDPIWTPRFNIDLPSHRELAYQQLKLVSKSGIVSVLNFFDDPTNIFTAHQMIGSVSGSAATKFTVHYNLFGGSIVALHTQRHQSIFSRIDSLEITGCFCLTELGYGNNAVQMETTAVYDETKKQFVIDSPSVLSQKYWITNGGVHANFALVFAQTIVKGKNEGINAFLVPIRDNKLTCMPGVEINDMGIKFGLNGIDNAALKFHSVRIPRENMLNKYADVNEKGEFTSDVKGIQQRFFKVTERLLSGRLCIASMTIGALKTIIYNTIKYSQQRKGVSQNGKSETPIFDYQIQRNALIPIISRTLALNMLHNYAKSVFAAPKAHSHDLLMICCVDKTLIGWHAERSITTMRERSGGQGFLAANMYAQALAACHAAMTAEGDNRVLMIKVVKDYLSNWAKDKSFSYSGEDVKIGRKEQLCCLQTLRKAMGMIQKQKLNNLVGRMTELKSKGRSNFQILMFDTSDEIQSLATAYGERLAFESAVAALPQLTNSKQLISQHFNLFALQILLRELPTFLIQEWICPKLAKQLPLIYNQMVEKLALRVDEVVEKMNVPVHALKVPIAKDYVKYNSYKNQGQVVGAKL